MQTQRLLIVLTAANLGLLCYQSLQPHPSAAATAGSQAVLRGRALEIVDDRGRIRASIKVHAAETFAPTGKKYPETVVLRLIDPNGRPEVKIAASVQGGGLGLVGRADATQVVLHADETASSLKLANEDGKQLLLNP